MGVLNKLKDHFNKGDFTVAPNKKVGTIKKDFKTNFDLSLRVYKGKQFAEDSLTINQLNEKTAAAIKKGSDEELIVRASNKVGDVEKKFKSVFGLTVQIADKADKKLCDNNVSLGDAARS